MDRRHQWPYEEREFGLSTSGRKKSRGSAQETNESGIKTGLIERLFHTSGKN